MDVVVTYRQYLCLCGQFTLVQEKGRDTKHPRCTGSGCGEWLSGVNWIGNTQRVKTISPHDGVNVGAYI